MKVQLAKAEGGNMPDDIIIRFKSLTLAFIFTLMLVTQLFSFEKLPDILSQYQLFDASSSRLTAALIVIFELATIPALLHIPLSRLARLVGWVSGVVTLLFWLIVNIRVIGVEPNFTSGVFGKILPLQSGWQSVIYIFLALGIYVALLVRLKAYQRLKR
jgi:glucan phosphoethanolaminetransferase (alkaline phosphatase superfamily)